MTDISIVTTAVNGQALLGECPVWDSATGCLYWIDIDGRVVHRFNPSSGMDEPRGLPGRPGSIGLTATPGHLVLAMEHEIHRFDFETNALTVLTSLETAGTGNRLNDGRCDPAGRFVVGSMFADTRAEQTSGVLHQVNADGSSTELRHGIGVSNGLVFDAERGRMSFADTPTQTVVVYDYDAETGTADNERLFFDYSTIDGLPDGACLDADGCYWSASVYGWALTRITPDGKVDRRIDVPVEKPSMPAFGGPNLDTIFVTTIGAGGNVASKPGRDGFVPGALLAIDAGVQGIPEPTFG